MNNKTNLTTTEFTGAEAFNHPFESGLIREDALENMPKEVGDIIMKIGGSWETYSFPLLKNPDCEVCFTINGDHGSFEIVSCYLHYYDEYGDFQSVEIGPGFKSYLYYSIGEGMALYLSRYGDVNLDLFDVPDGFYDWSDEDGQPPRN